MILRGVRVGAVVIARGVAALDQAVHALGVTTDAIFEARAPGRGRGSVAEVTRGDAHCDHEERERDEEGRRCAVVEIERQADDEHDEDRGEAEGSRRDAPVGGGHGGARHAAHPCFELAQGRALRGEHGLSLARELHVTIKRMADGERDEQIERSEYEVGERPRDHRRQHVGAVRPEQRRTDEDEHAGVDDEEEKDADATLGAGLVAYEH